MKNPVVPNIKSSLFVSSLIILTFYLLFIPTPTAALDNHLVYQDFPWKGMKVEFTASGTFLIRGHTDFDPYILPQSESFPTLNVILRKDLNVCLLETVDHLRLSGKVILTIPGPASDFQDARVDLGIYQYPPGDPDGEMLQPFTRTITNAEYQPTIEIPFDLSAAITPGYPPAFSIILQVCRWRDATHYYAECHTLDLNAVADENGDCFRINQTTPTHQQKNVNFDEPGIQVEFTNPFDPATLNEETFYVFYWDKDGQKTKVAGSILTNQENTAATFQPPDHLIPGL